MTSFTGPACEEGTVCTQVTVLTLHIAVALIVCPKCASYEDSKGDSWTSADRNMNYIDLAHFSINSMHGLCCSSYVFLYLAYLLGGGN